MNIFLNYGKQLQFTIVFNVLGELMQHTSNVRYCLNLNKSNPAFRCE